jgi:hypothetical protein
MEYALVGISTKIVAFVTLILGLAYFVNTSALTPILQGFTLYGITLQIIFNLLLLAGMLVGVTVIWRDRDQPPISKKMAERIALADIKRKYLDCQSHWIISNLTQLEGKQWHVVGAMLSGSVQEKINIWLDSQTGDIDHLSFD